MPTKKPEWLRVKFRGNKERQEVERILEKLSLNTVCEQADCPNRMECYASNTATFMIMGRICTRNCRFCAVEKADTQPLDDNEPTRVAEAVKSMALKHVVVTSVTRDDLQDGGAGHFVRVIESIKACTPHVTIEVLIPDFEGNKDALSNIIAAQPDIINHNIETIPRLYEKVRPMAIYERSLEVIGFVSGGDTNILTKSGIMVGMGETQQEVLAVMQDLRDVGCRLLTIGQYLPPSKEHYAVQEYIHPDVFGKYQKAAMKMGFVHAACGPLVRSSYHAADAYDAIHQV